MEINPTHFAKKLKSFRLDKLWTLQQMAEKTGVHAATLSQIENGKVTPQDLTIAKMRKRLPELFEEEKSGHNVQEVA